MAKSVKTVVRKMNEKLSRREASRQAQNERRKLQRRLAKELSKATGKKVTWKEAESVYQGQKVESVIASEIYKDIGKLKYTSVDNGVKRIGYDVNIQELSERTQQRFPNTQTQRRRNEMFKQDLNEASKKEPNGVSKLNKGEVHAFYAATQFIWSGTSIQENRNKKIMEEFGIDSLETIYKLIVDKELNPEDFGFSDMESLQKWIKEISKKVDIQAVRDIYQEELNERSDVPETKYNKIAIQNIVSRTSMLKQHA